MQPFSHTPRAPLISRADHPDWETPGRPASAIPSGLHVHVGVKTHVSHVEVKTAPLDHSLQSPSSRLTPDDWARGLIGELNSATDPGAQIDIPRLFLRHADTLTRIRKQQPGASVSQEVLDEVDTEIMASLSCWFRAGLAQASPEPGNRSHSLWIDALTGMNQAWAGLPIRGTESGAITGSIVYRPEGYIAQQLPAIEPPKTAPQLSQVDESGARRLCRWMDVHTRDCNPITRLAFSSALEIFLLEIEEAESVDELLEPLRSGLDAPSTGKHVEVDLSLSKFKAAVAEAFPGRDFSGYWRSREAIGVWNN